MVKTVEEAVNEAAEAASERIERRLKRDRALTYGVCPDCAGKLHDKFSFKGELFGYKVYACAACGANHKYYLGDD